MRSSYAVPFPHITSPFRDVARGPSSASASTGGARQPFQSHLTTLKSRAPNRSSIPPRRASTSARPAPSASSLAVDPEEAAAREVSARIAAVRRWREQLERGDEGIEPPLSKKRKEELRRQATLKLERRTSPAGPAGRSRSRSPAKDEGRPHPFLQHRHAPRFKTSPFKKHSVEAGLSSLPRSAVELDDGVRAGKDKEEVVAFLSSISSVSSSLGHSDLASPTRPASSRSHRQFELSASAKRKAARDRKEYLAFLNEQLRIMKADRHTESSMEVNSSSPSSPLLPVPSSRSINWQSLEAQAAQLQEEWQAMQRGAGGQLNDELQQQLQLLTDSELPIVEQRVLSEVERLRSDVISRVHQVEAECEWMKELKLDKLEDKRKELLDGKREAVKKKTTTSGRESDKENTASRKAKETKKEPSYPFLQHLQQLFSVQSAPVLAPPPPLSTSHYLPNGLPGHVGSAASAPIVIVTPPMVTPTLPPPAMSFTAHEKGKERNDSPVRHATIAIQAEEDHHRDAATDTNPSLLSTAQPVHSRQPSVASSPALAASLTSPSFPARKEQTSSFPHPPPRQHVSVSVQHDPATLPPQPPRPPPSLNPASLSILDQAHASVQSRLHAHTAQQEQSSVLSALEALLDMKRKEVGKGSAVDAVKGVEYQESGLLSLLLRAFELGDDRGVEEEWTRLVEREEQDDKKKAEQQREEEERKRRADEEERVKREEDERRKRERQEEEERLLVEMERRVEERLRKEKDEEGKRRKDEEDLRLQREELEKERRRLQTMEEEDARRKAALSAEELRAREEQARKAEAERIAREREEVDARRAAEEARLKAHADAEEARLKKKREDEAEIERVRVKLVEEKEEWDRVKREEQREKELRMINMLKAEVETLKQQRVQMGAAHTMAEARLDQAARRRKKHKQIDHSDVSEVSSSSAEEEEEEEEEDDEESGDVSSPTDDTASTAGRSDGEVGSTAQHGPLSGYRSPGTFSPSVSVPPSPGHLTSGMLANVAQPLHVVKGDHPPRARPSSSSSYRSASHLLAKYGEVHVPPSPGQVVGTAQSARREPARASGKTAATTKGSSKPAAEDDDSLSEGELSRSGQHIWLSGSFVPFGPGSTKGKPERAVSSKRVHQPPQHTVEEVSRPPALSRAPSIAQSTALPIQLAAPSPATTSAAPVAIVVDLPAPAPAATIRPSAYGTSSVSASASGWESEIERAQRRLASSHPPATHIGQPPSKPHTPPQLPASHSRVPSSSSTRLPASSHSPAAPASPRSPAPASLVSQRSFSSHASSEPSKADEEKDPKPLSSPTSSSVVTPSLTPSTSRRSSGLLRPVKKLVGVETMFEREQREKQERLQKLAQDERKGKEEDDNGSELSLEEAALDADEQWLENL